MGWETDAARVLPGNLLRVFLDSSILMAAVLSAAGSARSLFDEERRGRVLLLVSPLVLVETERNLFRKAPHGIYTFRDLQARLSRQLVDPPAELVHDVAGEIDPKDAPIVAAAIAARADYLVSYDRRHLLSQADLIRQRYQLETVTPDRVLAELR